MQPFLDFLLEKIVHHEMWGEISHHDRALSNHPLGQHVDHWVGASHHEMDRYHKSGIEPNSIMVPGPLEKNVDAVHAHGAPIRDVIARHHGATIKAYRGTVPGGHQSSGRENKVSSWTTDKKVAHRFGGASGGQTLKVYSDKEIAAYAQHFEKKGHIKVGRHTFRKNEHGGVDRYRGGEHMADYDSFHEYFHDHNEWARGRNHKINQSRKTAAKNIETAHIPVHRIVWATNRMGQHELIVRNHD